MQNLRWKLITIVAVFVMFAAVGVYPIVAARLRRPLAGWLIDKQLKLGLDLKGGVHLVLRVQTDDALRVETETEMERLREELHEARDHGHQPSIRQIRRTSASKACRRRRTPRSARPQPTSRRTSTAAPASNGAYTFTMKPNIQVNAARRGGRAGAADDRAPRERARRHRAEHRAAGRTAIRSSCSCPA